MSEGAAGYDCFYVLDAADRIEEWGGPTWRSFALDNGGGALAGASLKGMSIYQHVAGHFTQRFLREFFDFARTGPAPLSRRYRCDSPRMKRQMEMSASRQDGGRLRVEHRLVSEEPMAVEVECREKLNDSRADYLRCSLCNRLRRLGEEGWREPDRAGADGVVRVVHTVCADCRNGIASYSPLRPVSRL
jgi:hypothetical protein